MQTFGMHISRLSMKALQQHPPEAIVSLVRFSKVHMDLWIDINNKRQTANFHILKANIVTTFKIHTSTTFKSFPCFEQYK